MSYNTSMEEKNDHLEPRVAKLEVGLDRLTEDVRDLAGVVRIQGHSMESEIQKLVIAVTQASGPKKTDWGTVISALFLVMAIGSAVFWPLNQTSQNNKTDIKALADDFRVHSTLTLHPVGQALLGRVEDQLKIHILNNEAEFRLHKEMDDRGFLSLDNKLQKEFSLMTEILKKKQSEIDMQIKLLNDKMCQRVSSLEKQFSDQNESDINELRTWRNKASGLTSPQEPKK